MTGDGVRAVYGEDVSAAVPSGWRGELGASLPDERLALRFVGTADAPVVLVLGGISGRTFRRL